MFSSSPPLSGEGSNRLASSQEVKKKKRLSSGELKDIFLKPVKRKDTSLEVPTRRTSRSDDSDNELKEEYDSVNSDEEAIPSPEVGESKLTKTTRPRSLSKNSSINREHVSAVLPLMSSKEEKKRGKSKNLSCPDVSTLVVQAHLQAGESVIMKDKKPTEPAQPPASPTMPAKEDHRDGLNSSAGQKSRKGSDSAPSGLSNMSLDYKKELKRKGSPAYMQNKFDIAREEVENLIRDFRSVLHKKVIHHGMMYVYPNYICWLSNSHSTKAKIHFSTVTNIRKNSLSVTVETDLNGSPKQYKFSHLYKRNVTYKLLILVWRYYKGDRTYSLEELKTNKTLQDIPLDPSQSVDADSDQDGESFDAPDELSDEDVVLPPVGEPGEKPPCYDKGPILTAVLPMSVARFWKMFLGDESSQFKDAHIAKGDKDPTLTPWEAVEGRFQRVLEVKAAVQSKLIRGLCPIRSVQKCYILDPSHLIMEVESTQDGVPYCHDFITKGYWEISATPSGATEVKIWLWVVFLKSILVRGMIEKSSISGMKDFTVVWLSEAQKKLKRFSRKGSKGEGDDEEEEEGEPGKDGKPGASNGMTIQMGNHSSSSSLIPSWLTDWKVLVMVCLGVLLLVVTLYAYYTTASLREDNTRLTLELSRLQQQQLPQIVGGDAAGGVVAVVDSSKAVVEGWQKEVELLREQVVRLQQAMADWTNKRK